MKTKQERYLAYMLRLIQVKRNEEWTWHASLENAHTGERRGFASLEILVAFLQEQMREEMWKQNEQEDSKDVQ
jgi:hypothetical protein